MHIRFLVAAFGLFIGGGCSSDAPSNPDAGDDPTDVFVFTSNNQCRAPLRSGAAAEDTCTLPDDCAEVCCSCDARELDGTPELVSNDVIVQGSGVEVAYDISQTPRPRTRSFSAQACVAGKCSTEVSTCAHAEQATAICN